MDIGEELEVEISELSAKDTSVAKVQGLVIYVPNAKMGAHAKIKTIRMSDQTAHAEKID